MHKKLYASGFLYHLASQQILLQQKIDTSSSLVSPWLLFSGEYTENENPDVAFKKTIHDLLGVKIDTVHSIYSYFNDNGTNQCIVYGEIKEVKDFPPKNGHAFAWFSFRDVVKLHVASQTKHDIVVGQRVIDLAKRVSEGVVPLVHKR